MDSTDRLAEKMLREDRTLLDDAMRQGTRYRPPRTGALVEIDARVPRRVAEAAVGMAARRILGGPPL